MAYPYSSPRLEYRAIRPTDSALFAAIAADTTGYMNSSTTNIHLPTPADSDDFQKYCVEKCLLGAVIWLKHTTPPSTEDTKTDADAKSDEKNHLVEPWGTAIGEIHLSRLAPDNVHHRWTEVGIDILPAYQGKGYGGEAIQWALDYAFRLAGLHRVKIRALGWNEGAVRLYQKLGFKLEGTEREAYWHQGRFWDGFDLGMLEGEWRAMREKEKGEDGK
jgi:RimJ/RimL family protein N-acetyltransferase